MAVSGPEDAKANEAWCAAEANLKKLELCARVVYLRHQHRASALTVDDLLQEGVLGFVAAWPRGRTYPVTFAMRRAEGAMLDAIQKDAHARFAREKWNEDRSLRLTRALKRAVRSLRRSYRDVMLRRLEGATTKEIADELGVSQNAVSLREFKAIRVLRKKLGVSEHVPLVARRHSSAGKSPSSPIHGFDRRAFLARHRSIL